MVILCDFAHPQDEHDSWANTGRDCWQVTLLV